MGEMITLKASDGFELGAYRAGPPGARRGLVLLQEIFGVNHHIRNKVEEFAALGFAVVAPALYDRAERNVELGYDQAGMQRGMAIRARVPEAGTMADIAASAKALGGMRLGIIGYCWGGTLAWWGATRTDIFRAASCWYGGGIAGTRGETPHCPVQMHFGETDGHIPMSDVDSIRAAQPEVEVYVYPGAGHGFGCDERDSFDAHAAGEALERTLAFFEQHLAT
jgi:carboxymethylenebutenolidase